MSEHETIADIIAEMRDLAENRDWHNHTGQSNRERVSDLADRLEAAHKRERESADAKIADLQSRVKLWTDRADELRKKCDEFYAKSKAAGDCAKLREALKQVNELNDLWFDTFTLPDGATSIHDEIEDVISAALAAPPRNCDVYTADELKVIFNSELVSELPIANEHEKNLITITAMRMIDTLFATTKEGGNDANE